MWPISFCPRGACQGSAGHWLPAATWRQAIGEPTAPPVTQHLNPVAQSVSWPQGEPEPPFPVMHEVVGVMSTPFCWALHAVLYVLPSHPQTGSGAHTAPPTKRGMQVPVWSPLPQLPLENSQ